MAGGAVHRGYWLLQGATRTCRAGASDHEAGTAPARYGVWLWVHYPLPISPIIRTPVKSFHPLAPWDWKPETCFHVCNNHISEDSHAQKGPTQALTSAMISSVTAGTSGMPKYTIRLWSRSEGKSGGGPILAPSRSLISSATPPAPPIIWTQTATTRGHGDPPRGASRVRS